MHNTKTDIADIHTHHTHYKIRNQRHTHAKYTTQKQAHPNLTTKAPKKKHSSLPRTAKIRPQRIRKKEVDHPREAHPKNEVPCLITNILSLKSWKCTIAATTIAAVAATVPTLQV